MESLQLSEFEKELLSKYTNVVGIDEVGRGCWAGPVYVGAYLINSNTNILPGVNDSKKISLKNRTDLFKKLSQHKYLIKSKTSKEIDLLGIGVAIEYCISDIVNELSDGNTFFIIDGQFTKDFGTHSKKVIKGDSTHYSIASASIIAKHLRDSYMFNLANKFTNYGFDNHVGYGTKKHIEALSKFGPTEEHRFSYKPIKTLVESKKLS